MTPKTASQLLLDALSVSIFQQATGILHPHSPVQSGRNSAATGEVSARGCDKARARFVGSTPTLKRHVLVWDGMGIFRHHLHLSILGPFCIRPPGTFLVLAGRR